jgi:monoamine oxidase
LKHKKVNLSDTVKFGCVVKEIQNEGQTILIKTINNGRAEDFKCLKVIVNVPIATLKNIKISKLSEGKRLILENQLQTTNKKSFIISKQPFWRKLGFSGDCLFGPEYNINMTHDISPSDGSFGVLVFFHNGSKYSQW